MSADATGDPLAWPVSFPPPAGLLPRCATSPDSAQTEWAQRVSNTLRAVPSSCLQEARPTECLWIARAARHVFVGICPVAAFVEFMPQMLIEDAERAEQKVAGAAEGAKRFRAAG